MFLLQATDIQKQYGPRTILQFDSLQIYEGDRIGIIGANGSGKSTLLGILSGDILPDAGRVIRHCEISVIRQLPAQEGTLSGGENARFHIRNEIQRGGAVLLADEPTANLDQAASQWVRGLLLAAPTVLLVSHDRDLLNDICNKMIEIRDGKLHIYTGSYADYERMAAEAVQRQQGEYGRYVQKKAQLEAAVQVRASKVARQRQKKRREHARNSSEARLRGDKRAASMKQQEQAAKILQGRLDRLRAVERVREPPKITFDFSLTCPPGNKLVVQCENLHFAYGRHILFSGASFVVKNRAKLAITGKNGAGKSTLLRLVRDSCGEASSSIRCAPALRPGFLYQDFQNLDPGRSVLENVLATSVQDQASVRSILAGLLFRGDEVHKLVSVLSGGEKMRLSLAKLVASDANALLLDEPTNYLDIRSIEAVEQVLRAYPGTVLLVSHDSRFVDAVTSEQLVIENRNIHRLEPAPPADPAQKTLLELRRARLLSELSAAPAERKLLLEEEYQQVLQLLRQLGI